MRRTKRCGNEAPHATYVAQSSHWEKSHAVRRLAERENGRDTWNDIA